jgi:hypothetical protein
MIQEMEALLPDSSNPNFRERLAAHIETLADRMGPDGLARMRFLEKADALLALYESVFGVTDVIEAPLGP